MPQNVKNVEEMYARQREANARAQAEADRQRRAGPSTFQSTPLSELVKASQQIQASRSALPARAVAGPQGRLVNAPESLLALMLGLE